MGSLLLAWFWQCCLLGRSAGLQSFEEVARKSSAEAAEASDFGAHKADKLKADLESALNEAAKLRVCLLAANLPVAGIVSLSCTNHNGGHCLQALLICIGDVWLRNVSKEHGFTALIATPDLV